MKNPRFGKYAILLSTAVLFGSPAQASLLYSLTFENGTSASLANGGTLGGNATSVISPYNIAPVPTADNAEVHSGLWSEYFTPNLSSNVSYAGTVLLPASTDKFRMDATSARMTIGVWVNWDGTVGSNNRYGIVNTLNSSQNTGWSFYIDNNGKLAYNFIQTSSGNARTRTTVNAVITPGQWTHVALTWDASVTNSSAILIYVNGVLQSTTGASLVDAVAVPGVDATLGALDIALGSLSHSPGTGGSFSLHGNLDDCALWDTVLSVSKLRALVTAAGALPWAASLAMDELFYVYDNQTTATLGGFKWSHGSGFDVSGHSLGDTWKGEAGKYFIWLAGDSSAPTGLVGVPERKLFAHYMGCYPIGYGAMPYHVSHLAETLNPYGTDYVAGVGGSLVNLPLLPQDLTLTSIESAELEIKRAIRGGIDGFAIDAWAGGDTAKATLNALFTAAENLGVPFQLTICLDPSCHTVPAGGVMVQPYADSINWLISNHGGSPHLARRDGKVLIFGYGSNGILRDATFNQAPMTAAKWEQIGDAYDDLRAAVSEPLYIHYDFDNTYLKDAADLLENLEWAGQTFDAVGGFLGNTWTGNSQVVSTVTAGGAEWAQPLWGQYNNKGGSLWVEPGTDKLRNAYQAARESGSTLMQFVTWNDYGEDTILAPGYSTNYTLLTLNRYFADWWKTGSEPTITEDQIHLIFRRAVGGALPFPFSQRRTAPGVLEVTTLLTQAATMTVTGYGTYEAPAGLYVKQFALQTGQVSASAVRNSAVVVSVTAPEEITDKPFREDNAMVCYSSNFLDEWQTDFGSTTPLLYSENGDVDSDGLPNWFEMVNFGQFPFMNTADDASPTANPDGDGYTNLQEYNNRTDPNIADTAYTTGYVWNLSGIESRGISYNPDRDSHRSDVWFYRYRHGIEGQIPHDGNYPLMTSSGINIPYAGLMAHLSPSTDPDGLSYNTNDVFHGWIARRYQSTPGIWQTIMRPRDNAAAILGWRSPVTGEVTLTFHVAEVVGVDPFIIDIGRNAETTQLSTISVLPGQTGDMSLQNIQVNKGDFIHLFSNSASPYGSSYGYLEDIQFELE